MPETGTALATTNETPLTKNETLAIAAFQSAAQIMTNISPSFFSTNDWPKVIASYTNQVAEHIYVHLNTLSKKQ